MPVTGSPAWIASVPKSPSRVRTPVSVGMTQNVDVGTPTQPFGEGGRARARVRRRDRRSPLLRLVHRAAGRVALPRERPLPQAHQHPCGPRRRRDRGVHGVAGRDRRSTRLRANPACEIAQLGCLERDRYVIGVLGRTKLEGQDARHHPRLAPRPRAQGADLRLHVLDDSPSTTQLRLRGPAIAPSIHMANGTLMSFPGESNLTEASLIALELRRGFCRPRTPGRTVA
jgi:hypothetical protein